MDKNQLLLKLNAVQHNLLIGLATGMEWVPKNWKDICNITFDFTGDDGASKAKISLKGLHDTLMNESTRETTRINFMACLKRATLREAHELILLYCEESNQFEEYKSQPWFQFARIIRNVISHKDCGVLREWPSDLSKKGITSVVWRGNELRKDMVGQTIDFKVREALHLLDDQREFVLNVLD